MVKRALLVALAGESRSISPPSLEIARRMSQMGHTTGCHLTGASSPCFVGSPDWERTRWRSRRLRQLGKSSQPIETKWADLAPLANSRVKSMLRQGLTPRTKRRARGCTLLFLDPLVVRPGHLPLAERTLWNVWSGLRVTLV